MVNNILIKLNKASIKIILATLLLLPLALSAQFSFSSELDKLNYASPKTYEIGGITVSGAESFSGQAIISLSGFVVGQEIKVPGDAVTGAVKKLWDQNLFSEIEVRAVKIEGTKIFLNINVKELPRLYKFKFKGIKKGKQKALREEILLTTGMVVNENLLMNTKNKIKSYFVAKGFLNTDVKITQEADTARLNNVVLTIEIDRNKRTKIKDITFSGNENMKSGKLRRSLKNVKRKRFYNIFTLSKFVPSKYEESKPNIVQKYNEKGYRDARIVSDSVYKVNDKLVAIHIEVEEGNKYYFREIKWVGNSIHSSKELDKILDIQKGEVYNKKTLEAKLYMNQSGRDVSSLYMDNGYLFFQVNPVEVRVENDSIDLELRIYEGKQATINKITVVGNEKTKDHVIRREIRTSPGQLFSRADIIRTQRELAQLGYFNPETLDVKPKPNQEDGTVDIEYVVEEKPSDQIELSGGWGAGRVIGTLGVSFNNFSAKNFFKGSAWRPLPSGDGQKLSLRAQSSGTGYQSYSLSFMEPWLGGRKPNSLSVSLNHSNFGFGSGDSRSFMKMYGISVGLGRRLKVPDDYFTLYNEAAYQYYVLQNYGSIFIFSDGFANNLNFRHVLSRNSIDQPIYPRSGSSVTLSLKHTLPYSYFRPDDTDYSSMSIQEKNKYVEFHQWTFQTSWFSRLAGEKRSLVLHTKFGFGYLGAFNKSLGTSPFNRYYLGGDGLTGFNLDGREIIALRGYGNGTLSPTTGATTVVKYTAELRYPFSLNPSATIYGLVFGEAGNSWATFGKSNPFEVNKSAGVGIRIFMPMFGLLGLDWGYRFDDIPGRTDPNSRTEIHFSIGGSLNGW